ncbi:hypothetical protein AB0I22_07325 [Streptomyces sp. NPDC050610]|uniref:hypothetical protein n=1 Tax=Streptomyces sp. NPDC050610 TaxID=3157097 RepID=UPI00341E5702
MLTSTICAAVSAAGLGIALLTAYRKRFLAAARIAAYALVPIGLVMTGVIDWVKDLVFKPSVWVGFGVLAISAVLFMVTRAIERRGGGTRKERRAAAAQQREAMAPDASAPSLGQAPAVARPTAAVAKPKGKAAGGGEDFSDIEAILKKHGI